MPITKATTNYGMVSGIPENEYTLFKGVPYAAPPLGKLRLCPPVDPQSWTEERACIEWPSVAVQVHRIGPPKPDEPVTWTGFAKTGDPNTPGRTLWLAYTAEHPVTMHFANDGWHAVHLDGREKLDKVVKFLLEKPGVLDRPFF